VAKTKIVALALVLLLGFILPISLATATEDTARWARVNIPTEGKMGNWMLASGSDIQHLVMAIDGTLYAYGKGLTYTLYKSTDGGYSWSYTGGVKDSIVAIATAPDDASLVYYATSSKIYKSTDTGNSFIALLPNPGGAGSNNIEITSIDVARLGDNYLIAIATRDTDSSEYGGVYLLDEGEMLPSWQDTNLGNYDAYAVTFSPNFPADRQLVAVVTDETDTIVTSKIASNAWGRNISDAKLDKDNSGVPTPVAVATSATIAFPGNHDAASGDSILFVAIDTGSDDGDVYKINSTEAPGSSVATDLNIGSTCNLSNVDVTTLVISDNAAETNLLAGAATNTYIYFSADNGLNWTRSTKEPTGEAKTYVLMTTDFAGNGKAYAATSGAESAFSYTTDGGVTWNQLSLIDTQISTINDLALSPNYGQDNTLFMLTFGGKHSLWRSQDDGASWERVYSSALPNMDQIKQVKLSPQYGSSQVVFLAGTRGSNWVIGKSTDNGQTFSTKAAFDPTTGASLTIDVWAVIDDDTLFVGSFDGSDGLVYQTTNSGFFYSTRAMAGSHSLNSLALSPNYGQDKTMLVGSTNGWVYWSHDNGLSFELLPPDATSPPLTGSVSVAFDPDFSHNNTVYAASNTSDKGVYRFIIGSSTGWESIDSTLPSGSMLSQLAVSADGISYAPNLKPDGGMERCFNPRYSLGPAFETVTHGLDDGAILYGLWLYENQLWSIDTANTRLMTFTDSLTKPVTLMSPPDKAAGIGRTFNYTVKNVSLDWETSAGATSYKWQLNYVASFSSLPTGFEDTTQASSARLPDLEPATTYYWRVRVTKPVLSPWSDTWSFSTTLGSEDNAPKLTSPEVGARGVSLRPIFQWNAIAGADSYELLVSTDTSFANPVIVKIGTYALATTAWQWDINLDYNTAYYWKVRATGSESYSAWSAVSAFTTKPAPEPTSPPVSPPTSPSPSPPAPLPPQPLPAQQSQQTTPDWIMYLFGALLLTILLLLITLLIMVVTTRRQA